MYIDKSISLPRPGIEKICSIINIPDNKSITIKPIIGRIGKIEFIRMYFNKYFLLRPLE